MPALLSNIATLIAAENLSDGDISAAQDHLRDAGLSVGDSSWLDNGKAADISFDGDIDAARDALNVLSSSNDIYVQPRATRRKMLLVSDMDSTMITVECIDELADYAGIKPQIAEVTEAAMRGEMDFAEALRARVALLKGLDQSEIGRCLEERVRLMDGARTLVQTMRGWGAHAVLVSGGFVQFANDVAHQIGFHEAQANILGIVEGKLTGQVEGDIVDAEAKRRLLAARRQEKNIAASAVLAVGDGANDIPMIAESIDGGGLGAAYHAKPKAAAAANFAIRYNDLTALLYAQGVGNTGWINN